MWASLRYSEEHEEKLQQSRETEQKANFASYTCSSGGRNWDGRFVCLRNRYTSVVPCSRYDKSMLLEAGLGEKKVKIPNVDNCSPEQFREVLVQAFPKLSSCGGYEFLRCIPNTKQLEVIPHRFTGSPKVLKTMIGTGKVFIRPIQKDLPIETVVPVSNVNYVQCIIVTISTSFCVSMHRY